MADENPYLSPPIPSDGRHRDGQQTWPLRILPLISLFCILGFLVCLAINHFWLPWPQYNFASRRPVHFTGLALLLMSVAANSFILLRHWYSKRRHE